MSPAAGREPALAQLGLCTVDMAATIRLYSEAFGFADAGAHVFWGSYLGRIQGLGEDATCTLWWMVGRQARVQLELFNHVQPPQRPQPDDWRPSDLGWVRWGIALPDLDDALARLRRLGVDPATPAPLELEGGRRICIRDPGTRVYLELMEEGPGFPGGIRPRQNSLAPAIVYAAVSVADLEHALAHYVGVLGLRREEDLVLHPPGSEALWGLDGARCRSAVLRAGDGYVELVQYEDPAPRPRPADHRLSDQGFMNAGFLATDRAQFEAIIARAAAAGIEPNLEPPDRVNTEAYLVDGEGILSELMLVPREFEGEYGFLARTRFPPAPPWPAPRVGPAADLSG
ncbi:MAG: VOC family protein [Actinobacteria bacterium]|nr:VOC family protein [Actinomycetota bacterium]